MNVFSEHEEKLVRKMYDFAKRTVCDFAEIEAMTLPRNMSVDGKNYNMPQFREIMQGLDSEISGLGEDEVRLYANPDYPSTLMSYMRTSITKGNAEDFNVFLSKGEIDTGFSMLDELKRIVAFCTIAQTGDNTDLLLNSSPALTGDEMIELFIKSKISPISIFSVRINDFEKYYVNANEKTENEIMHAFLVSDNPFVDMGMYGTEIFEGQYSMIKEGDKLSFSIEFDMDKDEVRFFDGLSENSLTYPIPDTAKYKEGRTKANMDTMDIPDNLSDLSEAFSEKDTGVSFMFHSDLEDYAKEYIKESLGFEPKVSVSDNAYPYGIKIDINGREFYFDKDADAEGMLDGIVETLESELADKKRYYIVHNGVFKDTVEFLGYFESIDDAKEYAFERMHNFDLLVGSDNVDISYGLGSDGYFMWNMVEDKEKLFLCEYTYQNKTDDPIGLWYWTSDCDKPHKDEVLYYRNGKVFEEDKQIIEEVKAKSR